MPCRVRAPRAGVRHKECEGVGGRGDRTQKIILIKLISIRILPKLFQIRGRGFVGEENRLKRVRATINNVMSIYVYNNWSKA